MNRALRDWLPAHRFQIEENDLIVPLQGPIPVGPNRYLRKAASYFAETFHGCNYLLPEAVELESDLRLSGSGHASPADIKDFYNLLPSCTTAYIMHGGPEHLEAGAKIAESCGLKSCTPHNLEGYETRRDGTPILLQKELGEMVGVRSQFPSRDAFWLRRHFTTILAPIKPVDTSATGTVLHEFEVAMAKALGPGTYDAVRESLTFSLSRSFNMSTSKGFLCSRYPFGIERYKTDAFTEKRIGAVAAFDTETTGTDHHFDFIDQFSVGVWDVNKRQLWKEELRQAIPHYHTPHPMALLATMTPPDQGGGDHPVVFAQKVKSTIDHIRELSAATFQRANPQTDTKARIKTLMIAHNFKFDDKFMRKLFGENLLERTRHHSSDGMIGLDTRNIARVIHAIMPNTLRTRPKASNPDFTDFTLQALCEENGIAYDTRRAHNSALYDSERVVKLFWALREMAPDIVDQMVFNADGSTGQLLNDMLGNDTGFGGPRPVFAYLSPRADRPDVRMGSLVTTLGRGRYAVVMNLAKNPQDILSLNEEEILARMKPRRQPDGRFSPPDDSLELIDLRANPMILPAKFFYMAHTPQRYPREMFDRRAHILQEHLNHASPEDGWLDLSGRLQKAWENDSGTFVAATRCPIEEPNLHSAATQSYGQTDRFASRAVYADMANRSQAHFNPVARDIFQNIKDYREACIIALETKIKARKQVASRLYRDLIADRDLGGSQRFLLNNIQYDVDPKAMAKEDRLQIEGYRAYHAAQTSRRAKEAMQEFDKDENLQTIMVGRSRNKGKLVNVIRTYVHKRAQDHPHTPASRSFAHPWSKKTRRGRTHEAA